jgi:hypothetical protein
LEVLARPAAEEDEPLRGDPAVGMQAQGLALFAPELLFGDEAGDEAVEPGVNRLEDGALADLIFENQEAQEPA